MRNDRPRRSQPGLQPHRQAHFSTEIIQLCTRTIAKSTHLRTVQLGGAARGY
jgi:hypothetical protein